MPKPTYKYQDTFAQELTDSWNNGNREHVRKTIRGLKAPAQAAYIASLVTVNLAKIDIVVARNFNDFIHPNN